MSMTIRKPLKRKYNDNMKEEVNVKEIEIKEEEEEDNVTENQRYLLSIS